MTATKLDLADDAKSITKTSGVFQALKKSPIIKEGKKTMPDVAIEQRAQHQSTLDWVGMSNVALPIKVRDQHFGDFTTNASIETYVNLVDPQVKGIHMSRLYLLLVKFAASQVLTIPKLTTFLQQKLSSHTHISNRACLQITFDYLIKQTALKSDYQGWKDYPITIKLTSDKEGISVEMAVKVPYSSTCPCSSALARQLLQQAFSEDFKDHDVIDKRSIETWLQSEKGSTAIPHSQRSYASVWVKLSGDATEFPLYQLVDIIESVLKTPVQTAAKREDEQEFARLNGANQMFCEDAARRLKNYLNQQSQFEDFWIRVEHLESLHAHDAVAVTVKGIDNGYLPLLHR